MANLINQDRSRRLVIKKMKDMGLISGAKDITRSKKHSSVRPPRDWSEDEISELTRLFDEVRDSPGDDLSLPVNETRELNSAIKKPELVLSFVCFICPILLFSLFRCD